MSDLDLYADLITRKLVSRDGGAVTLSPFVLGDQLRCSLRTFDRSVGGDLRERDLRVRTLRASMGRALTAPMAGWFTLGGWSRPSVEIENLAAITEVGIIRDGSLIAGIQPPAGSLESQAAYIAANLTGALADWDADSEIFTVSIPGGAGITLRVLYFSGTNLEASGDSLEQQTGNINFNADTATFAAAVGQSFGAIAELSSPVPGCWLFRTDAETPPLITVMENRLNPISFVRSRSWVQSEQTWFEIRLIQAPLAFNDGHERVLPEPPTVRRIRDGSAGSETEPPVNELQALRLPPDFRGTYFLRWNYRVSKLLGIEDGPDEIAAALNAMFESGKRFEVTNPEPDNAYVEFVGKLSGAAQPLITVEVNTFAPGVLTFTLPLDRAEMAAALRTVAEIEVPFEVEAEIVDDGEDIADPAVTGRIMTLFQQPVKVVREQIWEELGLIQNMDWLRPPQPRDYIPFTPDQIIFGVQHYVAVFGDGELRSFSFAHNLGTEAIHLTVRENFPGGKVLADFDASIASANELILTFPENEPPPALNSLAVVISSAGPRSAFLAHTHTMEQIVGLLDALANVTARLEAIEDLLPTPNLLTRRDNEVAQAIVIPDVIDVFPSGRLPADFDPKSLGDGKTDKLPRPPGLLPAIHDATVVPITVPLPRPEPNVGNVFQNTTDVPLLVPGGLGRRGGFLAPQGFVGSDGRAWYRLTQAAQTNSFYPLDFERELFLLHINEAMWQPDGRFAVEFDLELQLFVANTRAQFLLVIEAGSAPGRQTPAPVSENLADVVWRPLPLLSQRIIVSGLKLKHHFGAMIKRSLDNVMSAERRLYTAWSACPAESAPLSPGFVLRARLVQFDTENSVRGAKGYVFAPLTQAKAQIS